MTSWQQGARGPIYVDYKRNSFPFVLLKIMKCEMGWAVLRWNMIGAFLFFFLTVSVNYSLTNQASHSAQQLHSISRLQTLILGGAGNGEPIDFASLSSVAGIRGQFSLEVGSSGATPYNIILPYHFLSYPIDLPGLRHTPGPRYREVSEAGRDPGRGGRQLLPTH